MNANVARNVPSAIQRCVHVSSLENSAGGSGTNNHVVALGMHPLRFTAPPTASDSLPSARIRGVSATHAVGPDRYPAGQGSHAVDPSAAAKKKSSQGSHVISPASGWIVPAGHGAHTSVPVVDATGTSLPETLRDNLSDRPNWYWRQQQIFAGISEEQWRTARACYYGRLSELDEQFGLLIDYLEASGQLENTVVIATADHGKYVGSHGMDGHNFGPFEEVYNIPLVAAGPGIAQRVETDARVGLHAIGPTLLEWADADPLPDIDAASFAELCADPTHANRHTEGFAENHGNRFVLSQRIVWDSEWKLAFNGFDFDELYNLDLDPNETHNRATNPECAETLRALTKNMWGYIRDSGDQSLFNSHYYTLRTAAVGPNAAKRDGGLPGRRNPG